MSQGKKLKLKKLTLENFRCFKGKHEFEFAPITLLFGGNGAGKSSILKAITSFNELSEKDLSGGKFIRHGGSKFLSIGLHFDQFFDSKFSFDLYSTPPLLKFLSEAASGNKKSNIDLSKFTEIFELQVPSIKEFGVTKTFLNDLIADGINYDFEKIYIENEWFLKKQQVGTSHLFEDDNGKEVYFPPRPDIPIKDGPFLINWSHPIVENPYRGVGLFFETLDHYTKGKLRAGSLSFNDFDLKSDYQIDTSSTKNIFDPNHNYTRLEGLALDWFGKETFEDNKVLCIYFVAFTDHFFKLFNKIAGDFFNSQHLGPLRKVPEKISANIEKYYSTNQYSSIKDSDFYTGQSTWDELARQSFDKSNILTKQLNRWLIHRFKTPFGLYFRYSVGSYESVSREEYKNDTWKSKERRTFINQVDFEFSHIDTKFNTDAHGIAIGISQIAPVILSTLIEKQKIDNNKEYIKSACTSTLLIEQPELHLHPKMQSALGDLFIFEGLYNQVTENNEGVKLVDEDYFGKEIQYYYQRLHEPLSFVIETHSEHLVLRLLRRIREGFASPSDISIYVVENIDNYSKGTRVNIDDDGEFNSHWPNGFFTERRIELM